MVDNITTVSPKSKLGTRTGPLNEQDIVRLNQDDFSDVPGLSLLVWPSK